MRVTFKTGRWLPMRLPGVGGAAFRLVARLLVATVGLLSGSLLADQPRRDFYNVLLPEGADPWAYRHHDGNYYLTVTTATDITLWRSPSLAMIGAGEKKVIWTPPDSGPNHRHLWAPEIHYLQGRWYVYYAANNGEAGNHRLFVLENQSADPFQGEFVDKGKMADAANDRWAIDGNVIDLNGTLYCAWSGWEGNENVAQNIYLARMSNPWTIASKRVLLATPTEPWERMGEPPTVLEAPQFLRRGPLVHLIYSASGSWTDHYCLGRLTARVDADLTDPKSWTKHGTPVFESTEAVKGPGHCSFVRSPDGTEDWILYHAARHAGSGWVRNVRAQPFGWEDDGTPRFGEPRSPMTPIPLPAGEPPHLRLEAERNPLGEGAATIDDTDASGGMAARLAEPGASAAIETGSLEAGRYAIAIRYRNHADTKTEGRRWARHRLEVNGQAAGTIRFYVTGTHSWSNAFAQADLQQGVNHLRFVYLAGEVSIDCIDLVRMDR